MSDSIQIGTKFCYCWSLQESTRKNTIVRLSWEEVCNLSFLSTTSVSPTELIKLSERISEFRRLSTQILAVSVDSPFSHLHYLLSKRSQGGLGQLNYPLISDSNQKLLIVINY
jgi:alkyl hydroperoxide reductase subunit AhpC